MTQQQLDTNDSLGIAADLQDIKNRIEITKYLIQVEQPTWDESNPTIVSLNTASTEIESVIANFILGSEAKANSNINSED